MQTGRPLRFAFLSYRGNPHCGGQGVYTRHVTRELHELGHHVTVFGGPPYPELDDGVDFVPVPSLDLYRQPDPFRIPWPWEFKSGIDLLEFALMCTAGFPEPLTFSWRARRVLAGRLGDFDVVHDNQTLGYGMLDIERAGLPLVTTIHHPITFDRRVDLAAARSRRRRLALRRWYGFLRMQAQVARQATSVLCPSASSARDVVTDFGVDPARIRVVPLGVDDLFAPPARPRVPGRVVAMASADTPLKGVATLLEAVAKLRTERDLELLLVSRPAPGGPTERLVDRLGLAGCVRFVDGLSDAELAAVVGSADVACVPSLYEGFSLPTVEAMACQTPLVASRAGAIPEVVGPDGLCADLVAPGDVGELAAALGRLLDDPDRRARMGVAGRRRARSRFSWRSVAEATARAYADAVDVRRGGRSGC